MNTYTLSSLNNGVEYFFYSAATQWNAYIVKLGCMRSGSEFLAAEQGHMCRFAVCEMVKAGVSETW